MIRASVFISGNRLSENDFSSMSLDQKIGGHHTFEIRLLQDAKKDFLLEKSKLWIGEIVSLGIDQLEDVEIGTVPVKEIFKGVVTSIELSRKKGSSDIVVKGHSPTILMDDGPMTQSFTDTGLQEIVDKIFQPYESAFPSAPQINPENFTPSIDYSVQYKESAFAFVNRLANRYGEWFFYDGLKLFFGKPETELIDLNFDENGLQYFDLAVEAAPTNIELNAYDYQKDEVISASSPNSIETNELGKVIFDKSKKEIFKQKPSVNIQTDLDQSELDEIAKRREIISGDEMVVLSGVSTNCNLIPGMKVNIQDKEINEDFGTYIITNVAHDIAQDGDYSNSFEAIPVELNVPPLTGIPDPPFCETQLGRVINVDDPDRMGRVQVSLMWQQNGEGTPWIRVASPYTGENKGFYIIPEIDDQVLVAFENNNPDKPYVLTGMYNGGAQPEWFNGDNDIKGFKSRASNILKFDDLEESILLSAPKKLDLIAGEEINLITENGHGLIKMDVGSGTVHIIAGVVNIEAADNVIVKSSGGVTMESGSKMKLESDSDIEIKADSKIIEKASSDIEMSGMNVKAKGDIGLEMKGGVNVSVKSSAQLELKGAIVKIN